MEYPSIVAAAQAHGLSYDGVYQSAERGCRCQGIRWRYVDDPAPKSVKLPKNLRRPVRCVETGVVYPSLAQAAQAVGCPYPAKIRRAARAGQPCFGYHWQLQPPATPGGGGRPPWQRRRGA